MALLPAFGESYENGLKIVDATVSTRPTKTWRMDLNGNHINGNCDDVDALIQTMYCILNTEQGIYPIYPKWYGLKMRDLYGKQASYIFGMLVDRIRTALLIDDRVNEVTNFSYSQTGDGMEITFDVKTIYSNEAIKGAFYV